MVKRYVLCLWVVCLADDSQSLSHNVIVKNWFKTHLFLVVFCSLTLISLIQVVYAVQRHFVDMLWHLINCR